MDPPTLFLFQNFATNIEYQIRGCGELRKTLDYLSARKNANLNCGGIKMELLKKYRLKQLKDWSSINDDSRLVEIIHSVISRYILPWMPADFKTNTCASHKQNLCTCAAIKKENFVYNHLREMGVDVNLMKSQVDAAFIIALENWSSNQMRDTNESIYVPPSSQMSPRTVIFKGRGRQTILPKVPFSEMIESPNRVLVEYLPKKGAQKSPQQSHFSVAN